MNSCKIKLLTLLSVTVMLISWDVFALPCNPYNEAQLASFSDDEKQVYLRSCPNFSVSNSDDLLSETKVEPNINWQVDKERSSGEFWDNWSEDMVIDSPFLVQQEKSTFYGFGVWLPEKYDDMDLETFSDAQEWIRSHGLQMSFGVGGEDGKSPRFRFDYRWHDEDLSDVFLQLDIPFQ